MCTQKHGSITLCILRLKCDGTRAETRFCLSAKRTSLFKSAGALVQSTTGSRGVRISGTNAGYTMFQRWCEGYWLPTPFASFPFTSPPVRHRVPSHFNWSLPTRIATSLRPFSKVAGSAVLAAIPVRRELRSTRLSVVLSPLILRFINHIYRRRWKWFP